MVVGEGFEPSKSVTADLQSHAVMAFLPVIEYVVAVLADVFQWEHVIVNFGFLQTDHVGLVLFDNCRQLMRTRAQSIDIKRDKLHERCRFHEKNVL